MSKLNRQKESDGLPVQKDMEKILSALANEDALKILQEAKEGITSSTETIKKLRLTQKRYYARLKPLIQGRLVEKTESGYKLTFLGKIVYEILYRKLEKALRNKDRIDLIDKLSRAESLSEKEKSQIASSISADNETVGYSDIFGGIKPVKILRTYEELRKEVIKVAEKAEREIYMASRYTDPSVAESFLRLVDGGPKMYFLDGDKRNLSKKLQLLRLVLSNPKMVRSLYDLFHSENVYLRSAEVPFSFIVVDSRYVGVELAELEPHNYIVAFFFEDELLAGILVSFFRKLCENAKDDPLKEFSEKIYKQPNFGKDKPRDSQCKGNT